MGTIGLFAAIAALAGAAAGASTLTIEAVSPPDADGTIYLKASSTGDFDGDGVPDAGILKLKCAAQKVAGISFHYDVKSPRDAASGQASGKRTHKPVTIVKEWGAATPQLAKLRPSYDVKKVEGARTAPPEGWTDLELAGGDGLCAASEDAARKATKSRSNIQNN